MIRGEILKRKELYFSKYKKHPEIVVLNYDTALSAFSDDSGGSFVCYDLTGENRLLGMTLFISEKLKNNEVVVGGEELKEEYGG